QQKKARHSPGAPQLEPPAASLVKAHFVTLDRPAPVPKRLLATQPLRPHRQPEQASPSQLAPLPHQLFQMSLVPALRAATSFQPQPALRHQSPRQAAAPARANSKRSAPVAAQ